MLGAPVLPEFHPYPINQPAIAKPQATQAAPRRPVGSTLKERLEGCRIVAHDGQFLGLITSNPVIQNSFLNKVGPFGSDISSTSIFNTIGKYGSEISQYSAFNEISSTPPQILDPSGEFVAFLTRNPLKNPRIDPSALVAIFSE